jgi:hypothetical protein
MPARQRGSVEKLATSWGVRFVDESGVRRRQSGFATKTAARRWLDQKVNEVEALRRGDCTTRSRESLTLSEAIARFLAQHDVDVTTTNKLTRQLRQAESVFGNRLLESLRPDELAAWRRSLPQGSRHDVFRALKQVLGQAAQWGWVDASPAAFIKNPKPKRPEIDPFESWDEIYAIAAEMDPRFAAIPIFAAGTGLRPEEWIGLQRQDLDLTARVVVVERVYTQGLLKQCAKTSRQRRRVPLRACVAVGGVPVRDDDPSPPAGGASAGGRADRLDIQPGAGDQPGHDRVRVPHLACVEFVAAPNGRRHLRHKFEQPPCAFGIVAQALRALDRLGNIRNDAVAPAAHLVAEEAEAAGYAYADRASGDDAALAAFAPCRRLLDHESSLGHVYFERRVVEVGAVAVLQARRERLEDEAVQADGVAAGAEREPIEVDAVGLSRRRLVGTSVWIHGFRGFLDSSLSPRPRQQLVATFGGSMYSRARENAFFCPR